MTRTPRKWLAWKLVQLAHRLHDPEYVEHIGIETSAGRKIDINVIGDEYGRGISSTSGIPWKVCWDVYADPEETAEFEDWKFMWSRPVSVDGMTGRSAHVHMVTTEQARKGIKTLLNSVGMSRDEIEQRGQAWDLDAQQRGVLADIRGLEFLIERVR
jgi:hypothetical protein